MEITGRDELGIDLRAPQQGRKGRPVWHYELVKYAVPGDIVFHWHNPIGAEPAIVGWSEVAGPLYVESDYWVAHTAGPDADDSEQPHWVMPLGGMRKFPQPVTRSMLNARLDEVAAVLGGSPYKPWIVYRSDELRAQQGYLTKMPADLVPLIEELAGAALPDRREPEQGRVRQRRASGRRSGQGWLADPVLRKAIESYAVQAAIDHYRSLGATDIVEVGKPYDLRLRLDGRERHVEVKGTTTDGAVTVALTINEVEHAWDPEVATDLFVLDGINYDLVDDEFKLSGGNRRWWTDWEPEEESLYPTEFQYALPGDAG